MSDEEMSDEERKLFDKLTKLIKDMEKLEKNWISNHFRYFL